VLLEAFKMRNYYTYGCSTKVTSFPVEIITNYNLGDIVSKYQLPRQLSEYFFEIKDMVNEFDFEIKEH
jgi:hypothetical protein